MLRVMIVDDEELVLDGLERIFGKIPDVSVVARCYDGAQAREYLESQAVDVVFSDIRMPVMDGLELAQWISVYRTQCRIVLISAYDDFDYARRAMACGVKNYLMKPIRLPEVKEVIGQLNEEICRIRRSMLWHHDLKREIQELELYHALISDANPSEEKLKKKLYYAEYKVKMQQADILSKGLNENLLIAGWTNIFRWCAPFCIPVLSGQPEGAFHYTLLVESIEQLPKIEDIVDCGQSLMDLTAEVHMICCADAKELIRSRPRQLAQEALTDEVILKAKEYIARNLSQNISRSDVAQAVHLDSAYFSKYFKKKTGMNFHDYLLKVRITRVIEQLEKGQKVHEAAKQAGFQNRRYFNQVFRQYTGSSPSDYRKKTEDV